MALETTECCTGQTTPNDSTPSYRKLPVQPLAAGGGLLVLVLLWCWGHAAWGGMVLPSWADTLAALVHILQSGDALAALGTTIVHAAGGALAAVVLGMTLGLLGGHIRVAGFSLQPVMTVLLGVPPIGWVVLALIWFGPGLWGPLFTVMIATMPIVFLATLQGVHNRNPNYSEMAEVFHLPPAVRFRKIALPEILVPLLPALSTVLALSWKVALTAELLGDGSGMGGRIAAARAFLDLPETMAWLLLIIVFVLCSDAILMQLFKRTSPGFGACPGIHGVKTGGGI